VSAEVSGAVPEATGDQSIVSAEQLDRLNFAKGGGLVTVVTQDALTGAMLIVAHADRSALERTLASGEMHYSSRKRGAWHKGATSGNTQAMVSLTADCDGDAALARVRPAEPACHLGAFSCFRAATVAADALGVLDATIASRLASMGVDNGAADRGVSAADQSATQKPSWIVRLLGDRNLRHKKLGEEAVELAMACMGVDAERAAEEGADLIYHTLVALRAVGVTLDDVRTVLAARAKLSSNRCGCQRSHGCFTSRCPGGKPK
jgi:phosphoribosyl-AMP cyclohydrolase / phosphoribosyl-ATP pyrophosphohydrolase